MLMNMDTGWQRRCRGSLREVQEWKQSLRCYVLCSSVLPPGYKAKAGDRHRSLKEREKRNISRCHSPCARFLSRTLIR